jgi:hypothetical protein
MRPLKEVARYGLEQGIQTMGLSTILIVVLILLLVGGLPLYPHSRSWGYGPSGILGTILIIVIILALLGRI